MAKEKEPKVYPKVFKDKFEKAEFERKLENANTKIDVESAAYSYKGMSDNTKYYTIIGSVTYGFTVLFMLITLLTTPGFSFMTILGTLAIWTGMCVVFYAAPVALIDFLATKLRFLIAAKKIGIKPKKLLEIVYSEEYKEVKNRIEDRKYVAENENAYGYSYKDTRTFEQEIIDDSVEKVYADLGVDLEELPNAYKYEIEDGNPVRKINYEVVKKALIEKNAGSSLISERVSNVAVETEVKSNSKKQRKTQSNKTEHTEESDLTSSM